MNNSTFFFVMLFLCSTAHISCSDKTATSAASDKVDTVEIPEGVKGLAAVCYGFFMQPDGFDRLLQAQQAEIDYAAEIRAIARKGKNEGLTLDQTIDKYQKECDIALIKCNTKKDAANNLLYTIAKKVDSAYEAKNNELKKPKAADEDSAN